jgi:hypothetical protein
MRVLWAGFEANTYALQQAGWSLAAEQDYEYRRLRLAFQHRDWQLYAISDYAELDFFNAHHAQNDLWPPIVVRRFVSQIQVERRIDALTMFHPIDAQPQFISREIRNIEDFGIFVVPLTRTEEIIVEPQDVASMLEQIKRIQAPEQAAIRARDRLRASREGLRSDAWPRQRVHAQVISIEDYKAA